MTCIFTPASNGTSAGPFGAHRYLIYTSTEHKNYSLTWWEDNSLFRYNAMLCSAFYGMKDDWNYRENYHIPKDFLLIADSGGFEQCTQGVRIEAQDVFRWQANNADIAFTLDIPPIDPKNLSLILNNKFDDCADASFKNGEIALKQREVLGSDIEIYYVLHGHTIRQLNRWTQGCLSRYDGAALAFKSQIEPTFLSIQAAYVHEKGIRNIHVLTGTGKNTTPIIIYLKKLFNRVTFDSSSYGCGARQMKYKTLYGVDISFGRSWNGKIKTLPCTCPVCQTLTYQNLIAGNSVAGALISLHNLYLYLGYVQFLNAIVEDDEMFTTYIAKHCSSNTMKAYEFLKMYEEKGFDEAYNHFAPLVQEQKQESSELKTSELKGWSFV